MFVQCALQTDRIIAKYLAHSITQLHNHCSSLQPPHLAPAQVQAGEDEGEQLRHHREYVAGNLELAECYKHRTHCEITTELIM